MTKAVGSMASKPALQVTPVMGMERQLGAMGFSRHGGHRCWQGGFGCVVVWGWWGVPSIVAAITPISVLVPVPLAGIAMLVYKC